VSGEPREQVLGAGSVRRAHEHALPELRGRDVRLGGEWIVVAEQGSEPGGHGQRHLADREVRGLAHERGVQLAVAELQPHRTGAARRQLEHRVRVRPERALERGHDLGREVGGDARSQHGPRGVGQRLGDHVAQSVGAGKQRARFR
jgi:hypothetical protein